MNNWNIPAAVETEVIRRDKECVYCNEPFSPKGGVHRSRPSWEHIINDLSLVTTKNIVLCCVGCNASKGKKTIVTWLNSNYCLQRAITTGTVSPIVQSAIEVEKKSVWFRHLTILSSWVSLNSRVMFSKFWGLHPIAMRFSFNIKTYVYIPQGDFMSLINSSLSD